MCPYYLFMAWRKAVLPVHVLDHYWGEHFLWLFGIRRLYITDATGAQGRTRTDTPKGSCFWGNRVYQFHHSGILKSHLSVPRPPASEGSFSEFQLYRFTSVNLRRCHYHCFVFRSIKMSEKHPWPVKIPSSKYAYYTFHIYNHHLIKLFF